jgi:hypothetical protein
VDQTLSPTFVHQASRNEPDDSHVDLSVWWHFISTSLMSLCYFEILVLTMRRVLIVSTFSAIMRFVSSPQRWIQSASHSFSAVYLGPTYNETITGAITAVCLSSLLLALNSF